MPQQEEGLLFNHEISVQIPAPLLAPQAWTPPGWEDRRGLLDTSQGV